MTEITMDYFDQLFTSSNPSRADIDEAIRSTDLVVDSHMNDFLCVPLLLKKFIKLFLTCILPRHRVMMGSQPSSIRNYGRRLERKSQQLHYQC